MSRLLTTAGTKIFIGPTKEFGSTDLVAADFTSIAAGSWARVAGTTNLGTTGDTSELIDSTRIDDSRVRKAKGTRNAGSMELVADLDMTDAGQIALVAAERSSDSFAFKIEFADKPAGANSKPSTRYFIGYVMSAAEQLDEANSVVKLNATIEIDSNIVKVAAVTSP